MITGETPATPPPVPCPAAVGFLQDLSLNAQGYALVEHVGGQRQAVELLEDLGRFVPQYGGTVEHEVVYRPGNDGRAYSQSRNA
ncbi:hypothetical protein [Streptomyces milbemycinicus]|uniref:Uncharacterized protein n=1 Tax=Streptomyces milbemycinicus TaxID=476552 RepID=A0ABW8LEA0_9ACTN